MKIHCDDHLLALQTFLSHLPLADLDDGATLVALQIANMHGLPAVAAQMCRSLGLRCWALGQLERAAYWLRRGHDDGRLRLLGSEASGDREQERLSDLLQATKGGWEDREGCWRSCEEVLAALEGSKMTEAKISFSLQFRHQRERRRSTALRWKLAASERS